MSDFISGVANPMTATGTVKPGRKPPKDLLEVVSTGVGVAGGRFTTSKPTFKPQQRIPTDMTTETRIFKPPPTQHTGIFGPPGYGKKDNTVTFLGIKPNKPVRIQGTKTK